MQTPTSPVADACNNPTGGEPATHPSRSAKLCKDCAHHLSDGELRCNHPAAPVSAVSGLPLLSCGEMRSDTSGMVDHYKAPRCGSAGRLFDERDDASHPVDLHLVAAMGCLAKAQAAAAALGLGDPFMAALTDAVCGITHCQGMLR